MEGAGDRPHGPCRGPGPAVVGKMARRARLKQEAEDLRERLKAKEREAEELELDSSGGEGDGDDYVDCAD